MPNAPHFPAEFVRIFSAPLDSVDIASDIDAQCINRGVAPSLIARIELALEALLAYTIRPDFGRFAEDEIEIRVTPRAEGVELTYRDNSPAFDPAFLASPAFAHLCSAAEFGHDPEMQRNNIVLLFR